MRSLARCSSLSAAVASAACAALLDAAAANESVRTECFEEGEVIYVSPLTDIELFDAEDYGVTLLQTIPVPAYNAVFYQFSPRDIYCLVVSD